MIAVAGIALWLSGLAGPGAASTAASSATTSQSEGSSDAQELERRFAPLPAELRPYVHVVDLPFSKDLTPYRKGARSQRVVDVLQKEEVTQARGYLGTGVSVVVLLDEMPFAHFAAIGLGTWTHSPRRTRFSGLNAVPDAVAIRQPNPTQVAPTIVFRRGRYLVMVAAETNTPSVHLATVRQIELDFATRQAAYLPAGTTDPYFFPATGRAVFTAFVLTTGLCLIAVGLARLRARRHRLRVPPVDNSPAIANRGAVDVVSAAAARLRHRGVELVALQIVAVDLLALGALGFLGVFASFPDWISALLVAAGLVGGIGLTNRRRRQELAAIGPATRPLRPGLPLLAGAALGTIALITLVAGFALLAYGVADLAFGPALRTLELSVNADASPNRISIAVALLGMILIVAGAMLFRIARMRARRGAQKLRKRDHRSPILYLRSFEDDNLSIAVVPSARRPFLELLRLRGTDPFEEAIAWELEPYGPVVAVGRPGRSLASLGAAREYLPDERWREEVAQRMTGARAIVIVIGETPGLQWELDHVATAQYLKKTIFVIPPIADENVRRRWDFTSNALHAAGPSSLALPTDPARALTATYETKTTWRVTTADVRDESTYRAAIDQAMLSITADVPAERARTSS